MQGTAGDPVQAGRPLGGSYYIVLYILYYSTCHNRIYYTQKQNLTKTQNVLTKNEKIHKKDSNVEFE